MSPSPHGTHVALPGDEPLNPAGSGIAAFLAGAAFAPLEGLRWLRVSGEDRTRWLNGMLTNSLATLKPGEGCYNFALNAQGRIQADATVFARENDLLIESTRAEALQTFLDRFIIMDDVELELLPSDDWHGLLLAGPHAAKVLAAALGGGLTALDGDLNAPAGPAASTLVALPWQASALTVVRGFAPLVPRFELWAGPALLESLGDALATAGATRTGADAVEQLRLLEGTPRYGTDLGDRDLPQETAQDRALHFSKGCYLGQEIVERIHSRGAVHRTFTGFRLEGELPAPGTPLHVAAGEPGATDRPVGELTSVARIPLGSGTVALALGFVRRDALERGRPLTYPGGTATAHAVPFREP